MIARELVELLVAGDLDAEVLMEDVEAVAIDLSTADLRCFDALDFVSYREKQRVVGVQAGYMLEQERFYGMEWQLDFQEAPHEPATRGYPAVRILGYHTLAAEACYAETRGKKRDAVPDAAKNPVDPATTSDDPGVTPEMLRAAWDAWRDRHGGKLGPGPAFAEALAAGLAARPVVPADARVVTLTARVAALEGALKKADLHAEAGLCCFDPRNALAYLRDVREDAASVGVQGGLAEHRRA